MLLSWQLIISNWLELFGSRPSSYSELHQAVPLAFVRKDGIRTKELRRSSCRHRHRCFQDYAYFFAPKIHKLLSNLGAHSLLRVSEIWVLVENLNHSFGCFDVFITSHVLLYFRFIREFLIFVRSRLFYQFSTLQNSALTLSSCAPCCPQWRLVGRGRKDYDD